MEWTHIETATQNESIFDLYEKSGIYKVNVDSCELMNGYWHESEDVLGYLAVKFARRENPHILIGGLGLGFTLAAAHQEMAGRGRITVAEVAGAVIGWFNRFLITGFFPALPDNVELRQSNVVEVVKSGEHFDVIALDVDNGPEPLSQAGNGFLYSSEGLAVIGKCLGEDGVLMVWSGFEDWSFVDRAEAAGYFVTCKIVSFYMQPNVTHYVYILSYKAFTDAEIALIEE